MEAWLAYGWIALLCLVLGTGTFSVYWFAEGGGSPIGRRGEGGQGRTSRRFRERRREVTRRRIRVGLRGAVRAGRGVTGHVLGAEPHGGGRTRSDEAAGMRRRG